MAQHKAAVLVEMPAVAQRRPGALQQAFEPRLPLGQRRRAKVAPVEVEKIEQAIEETVVSPFAEVGLQGGKIGCARRVLDDEFAIEQGAAHRQLPQSRR